MFGRRFLIGCAIVLPVMLISAVAGATVATTFSDVADDHWAANAVEMVVSEGLINGYEDGSFGVNDPLTRGQFAVIKCRELMMDAGKSTAACDESAVKIDEPVTDPSSVVSAITLSGTNEMVSWVTEGTSDQGFKVVYSKNAGPTYPTRAGDKYEYLSDSAADSASLTAHDGAGTYYVRVCEYIGGACGVYSNEITVELTAEADSVSEVSSITVSEGANNMVTWTTEGTSAQGFKVVYSKTAGPTYPTRDGDKYEYLSDAAADSAELTAHDGSGTYYVRVCEYLGGACGVYSNEITVEL